ncbi:glycoside hydrolase family 31 protein [uncultured Alistipes sp.]|uniref:glycoside hydrolase family 31 protein n=1 Tax=uncultured Alistipes sp. TaxID=538949 RepID=UPI0025DD9A1A|nr:glycoside hydrolase family 31 protein [uncultured Alistipes sp.]
MHKLLIVVSLLLAGCTLATQSYNTTVEPLPQEKWWGGFVALGHRMPYVQDLPEHDMSAENLNNQIVPLMLSSEGRYIWSEEPFRFEVRDGRLHLRSDHEKLAPVKAGSTLREAYAAASAAHFPPSGQIPEPLFFSMPQYNTWIELVYDQNQHDIMNYARQVISHGFPKGVFMIDDNWQRYYGNFDFKAERFPDPRGMIDSLHDMGFRVMLWVAPFVSPDLPEFREAQKKGYLLRTKQGRTAIIHWWNGFSACYDTTNPEAMAYLSSKLRENQARYGTDGFKFDGGDISYMQGEQYAFHDPDADINIFMQRWAELGMSFRFNELRACWKMGGQPIVQRLGDKNYSWEDLQRLIPDMTAAGLLGYAYTCPDMIGGGQFGSFTGVERFDEELIVRSAQVHALMPMMQFSVAPWRILGPANTEICAKAARLHEQFGPYILEMAHHAARTGEPIVRAMEYQYPHAGMLDCRDQFMLGDRYLVAPMVTPGNTRDIRLPAGRWRDDLGEVFEGPKQIRAQVAPDRLPYFERIE